MKPALVELAAVLHFLLFSLSQLSAAESVTLEGGVIASQWEQSTGRLTGLECKTPGYEGLVFVDSSQGAGGFEVYDELERRLYTDRVAECTVDGWRVTDIGAFRRIEFTKRWTGAPFVLDVALTGETAGLRLEMSARLVKQPDGRFPRQRNVRVSFVLPAAPGLLGWAPAFPEPADIIKSPRRYCYGIQEPGLPRTGIPMYTLYAPGRAGLSIAVPLDLPKVQLNMGPEPEDPAGLYVGVIPDPPSAEATLSYVSDPVALYPCRNPGGACNRISGGPGCRPPVKFCGPASGPRAALASGPGRTGRGIPGLFPDGPAACAPSGARARGRMST